MDDVKSELPTQTLQHQEVTSDKTFDEAKFNGLIKVVSEMKYAQPTTVNSIMAELKQNLPIAGEALNQTAYAETAIGVLNRIFYYANQSPYKESRAEELKYATSSIVASSTAKIEEAMNQQNSANRLVTADLLSYTLRDGNDQQRQTIKSYLLNFLPRWSIQDESWTTLGEAVFKYSPPEQNEEIFLWLDLLLKTPQTENISKNLLAKLAAFSNPQIREGVTSRFIAPLFSSYGLDFNQLESVWGKGDEFKTTVAQNLIRIFELEKVFPEAKGNVCRTLSNEFGIKHFARYPLDILMDMYKERNTHKPYGLALFPVADHSGAFYLAMRDLRDFYKKLKILDIGIRVYECGSKFGLAKAVAKADRHYGQKNKPSFIIIAGHGTPDSITFGDPGTEYDASRITTENTREILHQSDFKEEGTKRMGKFLGEDTEIILFSCSTGVKRGIAQAMSEKYPGYIVTAPVSPATGIVLNPVKEANGKIHIDVSYLSTGAAAYSLQKKSI